MIHCVCLVVKQKEQLLLVQARNRQKYYFPGGKIDHGETQKDALVREIHEELQLQLNPAALHYLGIVVGPAYPQENEQTELNCFETTEQIDWDQIETAAEITDIAWVNMTNQTKIAPAVLKWIARES